MIAARLISLAVGYLCGLFQTGYLYGKSKGIDIRQQGSGNAGTTNSLRVLGWKAGLVTFAGDLLKAILAVVVVRLLFAGGYPEAVRNLELYAGFGTVLGHNFPFYLGFKGGKGIACTAGVILAVCPLAAPLCLALFALAVGLTRYVSLGSILVVTAFLVQVVAFGQTGLLGVGGAYLPEYYAVSACFTGMALWRHRANIRRLASGTENRLGGGEKRGRDDEVTR